MEHQDTAAESLEVGKETLQVGRATLHATVIGVLIAAASLAATIWPPTHEPPMPRSKDSPIATTEERPFVYMCGCLPSYPGPSGYSANIVRFDRGSPDYQVGNPYQPAVRGEERKAPEPDRVVHNYLAHTPTDASRAKPADNIVRFDRGST